MVTLTDNSVNDFGSVLRHLCPDSKIAGNFQMGRKKLMYLVNYGLHPHFKEWVIEISFHYCFV